MEDSGEEVKDSGEEAKDLLRMILFLTILDSAIFIIPSLSSSVRKWIRIMRVRSLFIFLSSLVLISFSSLFIFLSSLVTLCSVARWQARALVSPRTSEMELPQRMHWSKERTIFSRGSYVTGVLLILEALFKEK